MVYQNFNGFLILVRAVGSVDVPLVLNLPITCAAVVASAAAGAVPVHVVVVVIVMSVVVLLCKVTRFDVMKVFSMHENISWYFKHKTLFKDSFRSNC